MLANSGDPDQMPHSVASDLGLHCLPMTLLQVSQKNGLFYPSTLVSNLTNTSLALDILGTYPLI